MTITHSPAPWRGGRSSDDCGPYSASGRLLTGNDGSLLALVFNNAINPQADADARLIAAAPQLLAAVQALIAWCEKINDAEDGDDYLNGDSAKYPGNGWDDLDDILEAADAALASIDGGDRETDS